MRTGRYRFRFVYSQVLTRMLYMVLHEQYTHVSNPLILSEELTCWMLLQMVGFEMRGEDFPKAYETQDSVSWTFIAIKTSSQIYCSTWAEPSPLLLFYAVLSPLSAGETLFSYSRLSSFCFSDSINISRKVCVYISRVSLLNHMFSKQL